MQRETFKKTAFHIISIVLVLAIFYFLGKQFADDWDKIRSFSFNFNFLLLGFSVALYVLAFFILALALYILMHYFHYPIPFYKNWLYFCITQPAKYIPGKVWIAVTRMKFFHKHEVPNSVTFLATGTESVMEIFAGAYISIIAILKSNILDGASWWGIIIVSIIGLIFLYPPIFYFFINLYLKIVKLPPIEKNKQARFLQIILLQAVYAAGILMMGFAHLAFLQSFASVSAKFFPFIVSITAFSYVASMIALFAPGGLGVREGVWFLALKTIVTSPVAIIFAFASRIWTIVIEAILLFIALPALWIKERENNKN